MSNVQGVGLRCGATSFIDPAFAPGTGTPEVGGLSSVVALEILERLMPLKPVGFDLVEVSPAYDHAEITALAGATALWTYAAGSAFQVTG